MSQEEGAEDRRARGRHWTKDKEREMKKKRKTMWDKTSDLLEEDVEKRRIAREREYRIILRVSTEEDTMKRNREQRKGSEGKIETFTRGRRITK